MDYPSTIKSHLGCCRHHDQLRRWAERPDHAGRCTRLPEATIVHRLARSNAWDNKDFVAAVKKTRRKKLLIAGISTSSRTSAAHEFPPIGRCAKAAYGLETRMLNTESIET